MAADDGREIWLVKVPEFLGKRWRAACDTATMAEIGPYIGAIQEVESAEGRSKRLRLSISESRPGEEKIPDAYHVNPNTSDIAGLHMFIQDNQHADLMGPVSHRMDVEVIRDAEEGSADATYRALSRQRNAQANTHTRTAQQVEPRDIMHAERLARLRAPTSTKSASKRMAEARQAKQSQIKLDAEQLEKLLFRLFERKPSWRMNELRTETRQSIDAIKKVLNGIAVQITKGPLRGEFELRSEYKASDAAPS